MRTLNRVLTTLSVSLFMAACNAPWQYDPNSEAPLDFTTTDPSTDFGMATQELYAQFTYVTGAIFIFVFALIAFVMWRFRDDGSAGNPEQIHGNTTMELTWTLIPVAIVTVLAVPTIRTIFEIADTAPSSALEVKVTGKRWWWDFQYLESGVQIGNELHLPVGRPVSLLITSDSVIHSFWTPRLGGKRDAVPGRVNRMWFTITDKLEKGQTEEYRGHCAEYCGEAHSLMRYTVIAHEESDFENWLEKMKTPVDLASASDEVKLGEQMFTNGGCVGCHMVTGNDAAKGIKGPNLTRFGERKYVAAGTQENTKEWLHQWIADPNSVKPGTTAEANPSRILDGMNIPVELTDEQVDQLVAYLHALKSE